MLRSISPIAYHRLSRDAMLDHRIRWMTRSKIVIEAGHTERNYWRDVDV